MVAVNRKVTSSGLRQKRLQKINIVVGIAKGLYYFSNFRSKGHDFNFSISIYCMRKLFIIFFFFAVKSFSQQSTFPVGTVVYSESNNPLLADMGYELQGRFLIDNFQEFYGYHHGYWSLGTALVPPDRSVDVSSRSNSIWSHFNSKFVYYNKGFLYFYDPVANRWNTSSKCNLPSFINGRRSVGIACVSNFIYIIGGLDSVRDESRSGYGDERKKLSEVLIVDGYDMITDRWHTRAYLPDYISDFGICSDRSKIYLLGGKPPPPLTRDYVGFSKDYWRYPNQLYIYDLISHRWSVNDIPGIRPFFRNNRLYSPVIHVSNNKLYIGGGLTWYSTTTGSDYGVNDKIVKLDLSNFAATEFLSLPGTRLWSISSTNSDSLFMTMHSRPAPTFYVAKEGSSGISGTYLPTGFSHPQGLVSSVWLNGKMFLFGPDKLLSFQYDLRVNEAAFGPANRERLMYVFRKMR